MSLIFINVIIMEHQQDTAVTPQIATDHSKMNHSSIQHGANPSMGLEGHNHHAMMIADFKKRFYVVLILTIPIMLLSIMIQKFIGVNWQFTGSPYVLFALSSVVFFYGGWPFLKGLVEEVKAKTGNLLGQVQKVIIR
jgi:Cu2+-exporting ATPase